MEDEKTQTSAEDKDKEVNAHLQHKPDFEEVEAHLQHKPDFEKPDFEANTEEPEVEGHSLLEKPGFERPTGE